MSELLAIGTFARMVRLTVKALRHYDAEGLLAPAYVDPQSGYRYYTVSQVPQATTIGLLRSLDLPVARVRELLDRRRREPGCAAGGRTRTARR